jgi:N-acylneuraminate cytidylyltransferase
VSSDDENILDVANSYGAKLIRRPDELSGDTSTSESGWLHAVNYLKDKGIELDAILAPQVTSPLRKPEDIDRAVDKFKSENLDSLFSASISDDLYFWEKSAGVMKSVNYDYKNRKRRQDFQKQIIENGSFYLFKPEIIKQENNRFGGKIGYSEMEFWQMFEIDQIDDVRMCSALMKEFLIKG